MDFTILAVVLLLFGGIPLRNKIYRDKSITECKRSKQVSWNWRNEKLLN